MLPVRVAIIGTAGRKEDAAKMSAELFDRMVAQADALLAQHCGVPNGYITLVSGGSAWADHVAVRLFLREAMDPEGSPFRGLDLHLPCKLVDSNRFEDTGSWSWTTNPGRMLNTLHNSFSRALGAGVSTTAELHTAQACGAKLFTEARGFHARNKQVAASCQVLFAFTWGESVLEPKDGGTKHTWDLAKHARRIHVPLQTLTAGVPVADSTVPVPRTKRKADAHPEQQPVSKQKVDAPLDPLDAGASSLLTHMRVFIGLRFSARLVERGAMIFRDGRLVCVGDLREAVSSSSSVLRPLPSAADQLSEEHTRGDWCYTPPLDRCVAIQQLLDEVQQRRMTAKAAYTLNMSIIEVLQAVHGPGLSTMWVLCCAGVVLAVNYYSLISDRAHLVFAFSPHLAERSDQSALNPDAFNAQLAQDMLMIE